MARNDIIKIIPRGIAHRITSQGIRRLTGVLPRDTRGIVAGARSVGIPIGSDATGYFIAESPEELYSTIKSLTAKRDALDDVINGLLHARWDWEDDKEYGRARSVDASDCD